MPVLYVVAGPNGAGKTTVFNSLIPTGVDYINADLVVKSIREQAGGLNVQDIANHEVAKLFYSKIEKRESFAIETNLCDLETYKSFIGVQGLGYEVNIFFLCVDSLDICIGRVNQRVSQGGHNVNPDVILSRYITGQKLLGHSLGPLNKQAELHMGKMVFKSGQLSEWVKNIISDATQAQDKPTSIEEVRKRYKGND